MINFRYHIVSLTAVFLALAIGLVVGTAAGNGPIADDLRGRVDSMGAENQQLREHVDQLTEEVNKQEQFATEAAPSLLGGRLDGRRILVVNTPEADEYVDGVLQMLSIAGAKLAGRVQIEDKFTDPKSNSEMLDLALNAVPPGISGTLPSRSNGVETSTTLLAAVLVAGQPVDGVRTVLSAYSSQGYITVTGEPTPAEAVIFLAQRPYVGDDAKPRNAALLTVVDRFRQAGRTVVATPGASGDGNVLRVVRDDASLAKSVSTVDNVSTSQGRVVTVLALIEQLAGRTGHYGIGSGATSLMPRPASTRDGS